MRARVVVALLTLTVAAGCGSSSTPPPAVTVSPVEGRPAGAQEVTTAPLAGDADCDREASLRPGPQPAPGAMPPGSTMAAIADRGRLVVGVDQNTYLFGFRDPASGKLTGFDIDIAHEIARALFGDPFLTKWIFDVEILARLRNYLGREAALGAVIEVPLMEWSEVGGSKLRSGHMLKVPLELLRVSAHYNRKPGQARARGASASTRGVK